MPISDLLIVSVITLAFVAFAVVLAWGDHQTRDIARASRERALKGARAAPLKPKTAAENPAHPVAENSKAPVQA